MFCVYLLEQKFYFIKYYSFIHFWYPFPELFVSIPFIHLKKKKRFSKGFPEENLSVPPGQVRKLACPHLSRSPYGTKEFSSGKPSGQVRTEKEYQGAVFLKQKYYLKQKKVVLFLK